MPLSCLAYCHIFTKHGERITPDLDAPSCIQKLLEISWADDKYGDEICFGSRLISEYLNI